MWVEVILCNISLVFFRHSASTLCLNKTTLMLTNDVRPLGVGRNKRRAKLTVTVHSINTVMDGGQQLPGIDEKKTFFYIYASRLGQFWEGMHRLSLFGSINLRYTSIRV